LGVIIAIISVFLTILFGIPSYISVYYAKKDHDKKNQASVTQEGKGGVFDERFNRAIDQLGSEKTEPRLGGIYALERIANESEKDYWPIMEILTTYIRENFPFKKNIDINSVEYLNEPSENAKVKTDIQAILTVFRS
jgi:hypothetical protein